MSRIKCLCIALLTLFIFVSADCEDNTNQKSVSGAEQVKPPEVPKNSRGNTVEQQNIYDRIQVTTDPTKVLWIHLIALDGKIVRRMPVRCKTTSSGKRLEPKHAAATGEFQDGEYPSYNGQFTDEIIQADGTYGESDEYQFWFDPMNRYHQWGTAGGLGYLLTDYPIDLVDPIDQITGLYKVQEAAAKWQSEQEAELRKQEGK